MDSEQRDYHAMVRTTLRTFTDHATITTAPPALVRAKNALVTVEARINAARRRQGEALTGIAAQKNDLKSTTVEATLPIAGTLHAFAAEQEDKDLLTRADIARSTLLKLPDQDSAHACSDVIDLAQKHSAALIADFGLTHQALEDAADLVEEYSALIGAPRSAIIRRKTAGQDLEAAIDTARDLLTNRLDPISRLFNDPADATKKAFFDAYQSARQIIGGSGASPETPPTPQPPAA